MPAPGCSRRSAPGRRRRRRAARTPRGARTRGSRTSTPGWRRRQVGDRPGAARGGSRGEARDADGAGRLGVGVEVEPRGIDRRQDRDGVVGQPPAGRGEPDPAPDRLDQRRPRLARQRAICCDTVEVVGVHRSATARMEPRRDSSSSTRSRRRSIAALSVINERYVHDSHVDVNGLVGFDGGMNQHSAPASAPPWRWRRCSASSSAWRCRSALIDEIGAEGAAWLRLAWAGVMLLVVVRPRRSRLHAARRSPRASLLGLVTAGAHDAVHGRPGAAAAGHGQRAGVPRPARRRRRQGRGRTVWPALAAVGVLLLTQPWEGRSTRSASASRWPRRLCWAAYILLTQRVGDGVAGSRRSR